MTQHTPGPWRVCEVHRNRVNAGDFQYLPANSKGAPMSEWQANARLIAAAPDLLAALQNVIKYWDLKDPNRGAAFETAIHQARAAIAKATMP